MTLDLEDLRRKAEVATPGPWEWAHEEYNNAIAPMSGPPDNRKRRPKKGYRVRDTLVSWLRGPANCPHPDQWDWKTVFRLRWSSIKGTTLFNEGGFSPQDQAYIAAANPATILFLLDEIKQARKHALMEAALVMDGHHKPYAANLIRDLLDKEPV